MQNSTFVLVFCLFVCVWIYNGLLLYPTYITGICLDNEFNCGHGYCIDIAAKCDGFNDCLNNAEERRCGKVIS